MELGQVKDISIVVAGIVGFVGLVSGTFEYRRQRRHIRAQHFIDLRRRFLENERFREILDLLASDDPALASQSIQDRRNLVGFLEEVAIMVDSRLIRMDVAHYMFGYYVHLVADSEHFWEGLQPDSEYWTLFRQFVKELYAFKPALNPKALQF